MKGLLLKSLREAGPPALLFSFALGAVMWLLTFIIPQLQKEIGQLLAQMPLAKTMVAALLGIDVDQEMSRQMLQSFVWVHPAVLSLVWGHEIVFCTRFPVAEIDNGTIDVLLGFPVSRRQIYFAETLVWLATGILLLACGAAGYAISARHMAEELRPDASHVLLVLANLYGVYFAVGGFAYFVSCCSNRRGTAIAVIFATLLASFLLTFLAQFWSPAEQIGFLSVLHYYKPAPMLRTGDVPWGNLLALVSFGLAAWTAGGLVLSRRNIATV